MSKFKVGDEVTSCSMSGAGVGVITKDMGYTGGARRWQVEWTGGHVTGPFGWVESDLAQWRPEALDEVGRSPSWTPQQEAALKQSIGEHYVNRLQVPPAPLPAGLTKREWFAGQALAAMPGTFTVSEPGAKAMARSARTVADALLAELAKA